jgi:hypothetical protein
MKRWLAGLLVVLVAACAPVDDPNHFRVYEAPRLAPIATPKVMTEVDPAQIEPKAGPCTPLMVAQAQWLDRNLARVRLGMTPDQVAKVIGGAAYTREVTLKDGRAVTVLFYHTPQTICREPDSSQELRPMVFEGGKLVGMGEAYYGQFVAPQLP